MVLFEKSEPKTGASHLLQKILHAALENRKVKNFLMTFSMVGMVIMLDQGSKEIIRLYLPLGHGFNLIPYLLDLLHVENKGISFGLLSRIPEGPRIPILSTISIVALMTIFRYWCKHCDDLNINCRISFLIIMGGAIGNLIDRLYYGQVTDFLHFRFGNTSFFVNNLADIFISLGVVFYLFGMWRTKKDQALSEIPPQAL